MHYLDVRKKRSRNEFEEDKDRELELNQKEEILWKNSDGTSMSAHPFLPFFLFTGMHFSLLFFYFPLSFGFWLLEKTLKIEEDKERSRDGWIPQLFPFCSILPSISSMNLASFQEHFFLTSLSFRIIISWIWLITHREYLSWIY